MDPTTANPLTEGGGQAISFHQALGSLLTDEQPAAPAQTEPTPAAEPVKPSKPQAPKQAAAAEPPAAEAVEAEEVSEEATDEGAGDDAPRYDPPAHWKKAAKELFASLSPEVQAQLVAQERERDQHVNRKMEEAAELRKGAESERSSIESERQRLKSALDTLIPQLKRTLQGKYAGVDWQKLAQERPDQYVALRAQAEADVAQLQRAEQEQKALQDQQQAASQKERDDLARKEWGALLDKRPEFKDPAKAKKFFEDVNAYAIEQGYTPEQIASNVLHLNLITLEKAMKYDRAQAKLPAAIARPVPQVQQPGTAKAKGDRAAEMRAAQLKKLDQTGDINDALGLLRR